MFSGTPVQHESNTDDKTMFQCEECNNFFNSMDVFRKHKCCSSSKTGQSLQPEEKGTYSWNRSSTLLLINLYSQFKNDIRCGKLKKKTLWERVSSELSKQGYHFTPDQVCGRWKSLLRGYKNAKDHNKKSGNDYKTYEYEDELDEIFNSDPAINPMYTLSSHSQSSQAEFEASTSVTESPDELPELDNLNESKIETSSDSCTEKRSRKRKSTASGESDVVDVFKQFVEDQKAEWAKRETMHKERISVMKSLVDALKQGRSKPDESNQ